MIPLLMSLWCWDAVENVDGYRLYYSYWLDRMHRSRWFDVVGTCFPDALLPEPAVGDVLYVWVTAVRGDVESPR